MSKIKKYLIGLGIFIVILCILSIFLPKEYVTATSTKIETPENFVFNTLNNLEQYPKYSAIAHEDTSFHLQCIGSKSGIDASCEYLSLEKGNGVLKIVFENKSDSIVFADNSTENGNKTYIYKLTKIDDTNAEISLTGVGKSYFITNLWDFISKWKLKSQLKNELKNLSSLVVDRYKNNNYNGYKIKKVEMNRKFFISLRSDVEIANVAQFYTKNISSLYQKAINNKLVVAGMPNALFYKWDMANGKTDMAAALPTLAEIHVDDADAVNLAPGIAVMTKYIGESSNSGKAHEAIDEYILDHKYRAEIPVIEEYMTDPTKEPDPSKWITNIFYYVTPK